MATRRVPRTDTVTVTLDHATVTALRLAIRRYTRYESSRAQLGQLYGIIRLDESLDVYINSRPVPATD